MFSPLLLAQTIDDELPGTPSRLVDYLMDKNVVFIFITHGNNGFLTVYADKDGKLPLEWLNCDFVSKMNGIPIEKITFKDYNGAEILKEESCL